MQTELSCRFLRGTAHDYIIHAAPTCKTKNLAACKKMASCN